MIYLSRQGNQEGPFPEDEVRRLHEAGELPRATLYWQEGMADWRPVAELFGATPPPEALARLQTIESQASEPLPDPRATARAYTICIALYLVDVTLAVISGLLGIWQIHVSPDGPPLNPFASISGLFGLTALVFLLIWLYRAMKCVRLLGARHMPFSPAWSVAWFLIPLVNVIVPVFVLYGLSKASRDPQHWRQQPAMGMVIVWFVVNLLCVGIGVFLSSYILTEGSTTTQFSQHQTISTALAALPSLFMIFVVRQITQALAAHLPDRTAA
ncbi:MAG: hypothetical protein E1N59_3318 [Puniceicoccaceae bacterium 5H]|nr:MAG: hypothetical protein E1N59_3318 [Puniceicoccaceae bacterium 5H]